MSGSPVLNLTTGAVCAVLKRTIDRHQAIGGFAIPVTTLFQREQRLQAENDKHHAKGSAWFRALSMSQQRRWRAARGPVPLRATSARHLVVTLSQTQEHWHVAARIRPGSDESLEARVDLNKARQEVARLVADWASRGRIPEGEQIRLLGQIVFSALFPDELGELVEGLVDEQDAPRLLISLRFEDVTDPDLIGMPWEHLYLPRRPARAGRHLAVDTRASFARCLLTDVEGEQGPPAESLSVLLAPVRPTTYRDAIVEGVPDGTEVDEVARNLLATAEANPGLEIEEHRNVEGADLADALGEFGFDVVHYVGFGQFDGSDQLALGAHTPEGFEFCPIEDLAEALADSPPKLVVLQMCPGARDAVPADFRIFAPELLAREVGAVVAWHYPMGPVCDQAFNEALYAGLLRGESVQMAVQLARKQVFTRCRRSRAFASAALFLRTPEEVALAQSRARELPTTASAYAGVR